MASIPGTTPILGGVAPNDDADTYPAHYEQWGYGGWRTVASNTARDAIPSGHRKEGMLVQVLSPRAYYQLASGLANSDWYQVSIKACPETVNTVTELKAIPTSRCGGVVHVLGYAAAYDGGGFVAVWDSAGTDADNPIIFVRPNDFTVGGWRQFS